MIRLIKTCFLVVLLSLWTLSTHADRLYVADTNVLAGNNRDLGLVLESNDMSQYCNFQFDIILPTGISISAESIQLNSSFFTDTQQKVTIQKLSSDSWRVLCYSSNNKRMTGQTGTIAYISIKADASMSEGNVTGSVQNVVFTKLLSNGATETVRMENSSFTVRISRDTNNSLPAGYIEVKYIQAPSVTYSSSQLWTVPNNLQENYNYIFEFTPLSWEDSYYGVMIGGNDGETVFPKLGIFKLDNGWGGMNKRFISAFWNYNLETRNSSPGGNYRVYSGVRSRFQLHCKNYDSSQGAEIVVENEGYETYTHTSTTKLKSSYSVQTGVYDIPLFTTTVGNHRQAALMQLHNFKVEDKYGNVIYDYVPCIRNSDLKVGLYDVVNGAFYYPTAFTLTAGPEVYKVADAVDLGLSVKWASWNIGASKVGDYGGLYGAGDPTGEKNSTNPDDYYFKDGESICGTEYDLAHVKWGGRWRMPTFEELVELKDKCTWKHNVVIEGVKGCTATGPNGNSIFIPYAGSRNNQGEHDKDYRASLFSGDMGTSKYEYGYKDLDILNTGAFQMDGCPNWVGQSIRPVYRDLVNGSWKEVTKTFDKTVVFRKIRVKNKKTSSGVYCCVFFSTTPNDNANVDTKYNINFYRLTIGDGVKEDDSRGYIYINSCTPVGDDWYEYEFKQPIYFSHYQTYAPTNQLLAYIEGTEQDDTIITFSDAEVKRICVKNWDTNGDGELSEAEAAAVTSFGNVFKSNPNITSFNEAQFFTGIKTIDNYAFSGCSGLTSITIPNGVTSIGDYAFSDCISLTSITIPNSVTSIGSCAFVFCNGLTSVTISNSVTSISEGAFYGCSSLFSVTIPNNVTSIGLQAFDGCSSLTSITIPNSVTSIGNYAFADCSKLNQITSEITNPFEIYESTFSTYSTATLIVPKGTKALYKQTNYWNKFTNIVETQESHENPTKRTIHLATAGTLPELISDTEKYNIEELTLTGEMNGTDFRLLRDMAGNNYLGEPTAGRLKILDFSGARVVAGGKLYLDTDTIDNGIDGKIWGSLHLKIEENDILPDIVFGCCKLTSVKISDFTSSIGLYAMGHCDYLETFTIPDKVKSIARHAFWACKKLKGIEIPQGVTTIEINTFEKCYDLTSVTIPSSVRTIGARAFLDCNSLTSIAIPNSIESIDSWAFSRCKMLTSVSFPSSYNFTTIGEGAFANCYGLTSVSIPYSVTSIGTSAFANCINMTNINVNSSNSKYKSVSGVLFTKDGTILKCYPAGKTDKNYSIPDDVSSIETNAFWGTSNLSSLTIPNSVTAIGNSTFYYCENLISVTSEILKPFTIEENTFSTYGKATLTVPKGTKSTYQQTSYWNKFSQIVEVEDNSPEVDFIASGVHYHGVKGTGKATVTGIDNNLTEVVVPQTVISGSTSYTVDAVSDHAMANRHLNYVSLPSTVTSINEYTFYNCELGALIWNASAPVPARAFWNTTMPTDCNFLLYVKSSSYAPSGIANVIVDNTAQSIKLSDKGNVFYCPRSFYTYNISYAHNYGQTTGGGKGWETLVLPFKVQTIKHSSKGTLTPFALYDSNNNSQRPFWLYTFGQNGFVRASSIDANKPYIIAMPNNTVYDEQYCVSGNVTFAASNVNVPATPASMGIDGAQSMKFMPVYNTVEQSSSVYVLNASNSRSSTNGGYDAGSRFIRNLRNVYPFEAYLTTTSAGSREVIGIPFAEESTDIDLPPFAILDDKEVIVYALSGKIVARVKQSQMTEFIKRLAPGIYIADGKKIVLSERK